jgi:hypothetical protein
MKRLVLAFTFAVAIISPVFSQVVFQEHWDDGNWTANPVWTPFQMNVTCFAINDSLGNWSEPCLEGWLVDPGNTAYTALTTPVDCGEAFCLSFWVHQRTPAFSIIEVGICEGPMSTANRGLFMRLNFNNLTWRWELQIYQNDSLLFCQSTEYDSDRWINVQMRRDADHFWQVIWDNNGTNELSTIVRDDLPIMNNPLLWVTPGGYLTNTGGFYLDDIVITVPFETDAHTFGLWHFDETAGTIAFDASGNGYNMNLQDGAGWGNIGYYNNCADLRVNGSKVNSNHLIGNGWDEITIEAYIFPTVIGPYTGWCDGNPIVSRYEWYNVADPSYFLYLDSNARLYFGVYLNEVGGECSQAITEDGIIHVCNWYHVAMTWRSGEPTKIWLDGQVVARALENPTGTIRAGNDPLRIGCLYNDDPGYGWEYFHGYIDEVRISDIDRYSPPPPITITLTPLNPPIVILSWGGEFFFNVNITNNWHSTLFVDIWSKITFPTGFVYPVITINNHALAPGVNISADSIHQIVPGTAPAGGYTYTVGVTDHNTWVLYTQSSFPFTKLPGVDKASQYLSWEISGWSEMAEVADDDGNSFTPLHSSFIVSASPNPFNSSTTITFSVPTESPVELMICDIVGREVWRLASGISHLGTNQVVWNADDLPSGVYFVQLSAEGGQSAVRKVVLMK